MTFNQIYDKYYNDVLQFVCRFTSRETAEEITQDSFMKVHDNLHVFDAEKSNLRTWILNIARRTATDYWRKKGLDTQSISDFVDEDGNEFLPVIAESTPEKDYVLQEYRDSLTSVLHSLKPIYREVAILSYVKDYSLKEICKELNLPMGTVKVRVMRAKKLLREGVEKYNLELVPS